MTRRHTRSPVGIRNMSWLPYRILHSRSHTAAELPFTMKPPVALRRHKSDNRHQWHRPPLTKSRTDIRRLRHRNKRRQRRATRSTTDIVSTTKKARFPQGTAPLLFIYLNYFTSTPIERAEPAMIFIACSTVCALRSGILRSAIARS